MKNSEFSRRIKKLIYNKGLKTRDLSEAMNCPEATINAWKSGTMPSWEKLRKLAETLDTSPAYLAFGEDAEKPVFSNSRTFPNPDLRENIENHIKRILDEAEECPGGLEHMYIELLLRFPVDNYRNLKPTH